MSNAAPEVVISFKPAPIADITSKEWIAEENRLQALHLAGPDILKALEEIVQISSLPINSMQVCARMCGVAIDAIRKVKGL